MASVESLSTAGGCQLAERLGFNGAVATYKGVLTANLRNVCVVALDKSQFSHLPALSRFREEFDKILNTNPEGIAHAVDYGEEAGYIWAAFEYMKGVHLGNHVRDKGLPTQPDAVSVISNTVGALMGLHRVEIPHRIITPASIFIKDPGEVRLMHAGWAGLLLGVQQGPAHPGFMSNLPFLAPEVAAGGEGDFASDIYSLGANLYFLLTGQPTRWADDPVALARSIASAPVDLEPAREGLPWELADLLEEMLAFDPDERPLNLEALKERMDLLAEGLSGSSSANEVVPDEAPIEEPISYSALAATQPNIDSLDDSILEEAPIREEQADEEPPQEQELVGKPAVSEKFRGSFPIQEAAKKDEVEDDEVGFMSSSNYGYSEPQTDPETARLMEMARSARGESERLSQSDPHIEMPRFDPNAPPAYVPPPLPAPIYSSPSSRSASAGGGIGRKSLFIAAVVILVIVVGAGWGAMTLFSSFGSSSQSSQTTTPRPQPTPRQPAATHDAESYNTTVQRLRRMAAAQRGYAEKYGVWVQNPNRLEDFALPEEVTVDAWGTSMEYRRRYVVSAGPDKKWNTDQSPSPDDLWINSETMEEGGWKP